MRNLFILTITFFALNVKAQQFEWVKTYNNLNPQGGVAPISQCNMTLMNGKLIVTGRAYGSNIDLDPNNGQTLFYPYRFKNPDIFITLLNQNGSIGGANMIYTPNGGDLYTNACYHKTGNNIYIGFTTSSDSIRFTASTAWSKLKQKSKFTNSSAFIIRYDTLLNYKNALPLYSYKGLILNDITVDENGNRYVCGSFKDSLIINGKLRLTSKLSDHFLMKLSSDDSIVWISHFNMYQDAQKGSILYYNFTRGSVYTLIYMPPGKRGVFYSPNDSTVFSVSTFNQYLITEINAVSGKIDQNFSFTADNNGFAPLELKGNDNYILLSGYNSGTIANLKIESTTFTLNMNKAGNGSQFISCYNADNLTHRFTNVFDSCGGKLNITNIFNDSLYYVLGENMGDQKFDFYGNTIHASDFEIKTRLLAGAGSDFFAKYSVNNRLMDVWMLKASNTLTTATFGESGKIVVHDGNIYMAGNINYSKELALGKRSFLYSTGSIYDISITKYNCKPTAFFNYKAIAKLVNFKNISTASNTYFWDFGVNSATATTRNSSYTFPTTGATYYPKLIAINDCGNDTFEQAVLISNTSISINRIPEFYAYPNPASELINLVRWNKAQSFGDIDIKIIDTNGREVFSSVWSEVSSDNKMINISQFESGFYIIKVSYKEGRDVIKLIINR